MNRFSFALGGGAKKPVVAAFADDDSDEEDVHAAKRQRTGSEASAPTALAHPSDPEVLRGADKLAEFVAKSGRQLEDVTRERNPGNTVFKFLFDKSCSDYRYYNAKVLEFQALQASASAPPPSAAPPAPLPPSYQQPGGSATAAAAAPPPAVPRRRVFSEMPRPGATPAAPLPVPQDTRASVTSQGPAPSSSDPLAAMEAAMKAAEQKEKDRERQRQQDEDRKEAFLNETSYDRRRVVAKFKEDGSRGHHMQDYIPPEEMAAFLAKAGDAEAAEKAKQMEEASKISADNIGHRMLQKMGWREGTGLGAQNTGMAAPVSASGIKQDNLGLGAEQHGDVKEDDDEFEKYRKRMQLGYKHRPNPLGNPRKSYY